MTKNRRTPQKATSDTPTTFRNKKTSLAPAGRATAPISIRSAHTATPTDATKTTKVSTAAWLPITSRAPMGAKSDQRPTTPEDMRPPRCKVRAKGVSRMRAVWAVANGRNRRWLRCHQMFATESAEKPHG